MKFELEEVDKIFEDWLVASFYGNSWSARRKGDSPVDGKTISGTSFHDLARKVMVANIMER